MPWNRVLELDQMCGVHRDNTDLDSETREPFWVDEANPDAKLQAEIQRLRRQVKDARDQLHRVREQRDRWKAETVALRAERRRTRLKGSEGLRGA